MPHPLICSRCQQKESFSCLCHQRQQQLSKENLIQIKYNAEQIQIVVKIRQQDEEEKKKRKKCTPRLGLCVAGCVSVHVYLCKEKESGEIYAEQCHDKAKKNM